jgi:hypothetical protein
MCKGDAMRKFLVLPLAGLLLVAGAAPVAAGANTTNTSGGGRTIQGEWQGDGVYGYITLFEESSGSDSGYSPYGEFMEETGEWVECAAGAVDDEDTGEYYGFVGTRVGGWSSDIDIVLDSKLTAGSATGTFDVAIETVDECNGVFDSTMHTVTVSVDVIGDGDLVMFRGSGSYKEPGAFNSHTNERGKERWAAGSVDLGSLGSRTFDHGIMAQYSWSNHSNS